MSSIKSVIKPQWLEFLDLQNRSLVCLSSIGGPFLLKLFGRISGHILFQYLQNEGVSGQETLQLFNFPFPSQHMKRSTLQNKRMGILQIAFRIQ